MAQKTKSNFIGCFFLSIFFTVFITIAFSAFLDISAWSAIVTFSIFTLFNIYISRKALSRKRWMKYLKHWKKSAIKYKHKSDLLAGLVSTPQLNDQPVSQSEPDIYDYGAAKLLICEHDIQVDWLVMNRFHTQNGIVIIAESGYPHYLTDQVKDLITNNDELEVYILHNAGQVGDRMMSRVKSPASIWKLTHREVIDLGLSDQMLRRSGVKKNVIDQYRDNFPAHALSYHSLNRLLNYSVSNTCSLDIAMAAFAADSETGIFCDFG